MKRIGKTKLCPSLIYLSGKAGLAFKNSVTHGPDSITASVAAQCAKEQGKLWNFYEKLYNNQGGENSS
jgi:protein-disulfide isomerase